MKVHYEEMLEDRENEHTSKIKQLVKEFNQKMGEKDREFETTFSEALNKSQTGESRLLSEHKQIVEELNRDLQERDDRIDEVTLEYEAKLKEQKEDLSSKISQLQQDLMAAKQQHQMELYEMEERLKQVQQRAVQQQEVFHKQEVSALTQEWNTERKAPLLHASGPSVIEPQELLHHNQLAINALQSGSGSATVLQQQVMQLTQQLQQLKERHRLELAQVQGNMEMKLNQVPLQPRRKHVNFDPNDPNMESEFENLELDNMDLRAQVAQLNGQLAQTRIREKELQQQLDVAKGGNSHWSHDGPPSPGYHTDGTPAGPLLNEATQLEYLKNILFQYMTGKETKTLSRVIATIVHFSDEQTKRIISYEDAKNTWLSSP